MKKHFPIVLILVVLLLAASLTAGAIGTIYVNDGGSQLIGGLSDAWAIGSDGTARIDVGTAYALTGVGISEIGATEYTGGGGLRYEDGAVQLPLQRVMVGLKYYYSAYRDTSVWEARLENAVGSGYAFGYFDANRNFVAFGEDAATALNQISIRPLGGGSVGVYATATDEMIYSVAGTGRTAYFAVHPLCADGDSLTWFSNNRYYGDFGYADLGNEMLTVVNMVDIEHYVMGVCACEMGGGFPLEALKAQAVAARTYMMNSIVGGGYTNSCGFDLTADTYSQAYLGYTSHQIIVQATMETANQYLTYNGRVISAMYSAADGGYTIDGSQPYLRGVQDPYEGVFWSGGVNGHRLGMSQRGAQSMAYLGMTYKDILGFYYTGVGISYGYL